MEDVEDARIFQVFEEEEEDVDVTVIVTSSPKIFTSLVNGLLGPSSTGSWFMVHRTEESSYINI